MNLSVLFILLLFAPNWAKAQAPSEPTPCTECEGAGLVEETCRGCKGRRKGPCSECVEDYLQASLTEAGRIREARKATRGALPARFVFEEEERMHISGRALEKPGYLPCLANCGRSRASDSKCRGCKGSNYTKCKACRGSGTGPCDLCLGKGKRPRKCSACQGSGEMAALKTSPLGPKGDCPWCSGVRVSDCLACKGTQLQTLPCLTCQGRKKSVCRTCNTFKKRPCKRCHGSGSVRTGSLAKIIKTDTVPCKDCDGEGLREKLCDRGWKSCTTCKGEGQAAQTCRHCFGEKQNICSGCEGESTRSWEVRAARWQAQGHPSNSRALLKYGLVRRGTIHAQMEQRLILRSTHLKEIRLSGFGDKIAKARNRDDIHQVNRERKELAKRYSKDIKRLEGKISALGFLTRDKSANAGE
ncbi:MAG: hypothetical protein JKY61_06400 [Planctomycetes bacterium]|nr:hypothetical protein [Planctomycetota bacterium]